MRMLVGLSFAALSYLAASCASSDCAFHSQCGAGQYCLMGECYFDCRLASDCPPGSSCNSIGRCEVRALDAGDPIVDPVTPEDAGTMVMSEEEDASTLVMDVGPPIADDAGSLPGTGRYLDRCTSAADCASVLCAEDTGGSLFCTKPCSLETECASEHVCVGHVCQRDDTGEPCTVAAPDSCNTGLCLGPPSAAAGACTRACSTAWDCPSGYACTVTAGSSTPICVDIEKPCTAAADCGTGICIEGYGCTAECSTTAQCPSSVPGRTGYRCADPDAADGVAQNLCLPASWPSWIGGTRAAGAVCTEDTQCRSEACNIPEPPATVMCTNVCSENGGCGPGLGCFPEAFDSDGDLVFDSILLVCARAGARAMGEPCTSGQQCDSSLCDATNGRCTRLCNDSYCPTGWTCTPVAGFGVSLCR